jgi:sirohydrochlorin cobaltochelatase
MAPGFASCAEKLVAEGYRAVRIVPLFLARGGHLVHDIPELVNELRQSYPDVRFDILDPVGEAPSVQQAMADQVVTLFSAEST